MESSESEDESSIQSQPINRQNNKRAFRSDEIISHDERPNYAENLSDSQQGAISKSGSAGQTTSKESDNVFSLGYHSIGALDDDVDLPAYVKEHQTTLTFPEKLMITLIHVERECAKNGKRITDESIGWVLDGKAFVIRNKEKFCKTWVPIFFGQAKLSSFTRKLYRWGFRKVNLAPEAAHPNALYFGNENFQRENTRLLSRMRSITAAKTRSEVASARNSGIASATDLTSFPTQLTLQLQLGHQVGEIHNSQQQQEPALAASYPTLQQHPPVEQSALLQQALSLVQLALQNQQSQQQPLLPFSTIDPASLQGLISQTSQVVNAPNDYLNLLQRFVMPTAPVFNVAPNPPNSHFASPPFSLNHNLNHTHANPSQPPLQPGLPIQEPSSLIHLLQQIGPAQQFPVIQPSVSNQNTAFLPLPSQSGNQQNPSEHFQEILNLLLQHIQANSGHQQPPPQS